MKELDDFFKHINELREKHKDKGEFNAFHSIGFSSQETMHSKFISVLLDPKAQHGQKSQFLNLFIKHAKLDFDIDNVLIKAEKPAKRRRMDITIENKTNNSILVIENKIWAQDQCRQLEDYYKFGKEKYKNVDLMYLTPYGTLPSDYSLGETLTIEKVNCISYENVIIPWIEECANLTDGRLKHSLQMYSEVLRVLINRDKYMNKIFEELKIDKEKLKLAIDVYSALQGRNYIDAFSGTIGFFLDCVHETGKIVNTYPNPENSKTTFNIGEDETKLDGWDIDFGENAVLAQKRDTNLEIYLFNPRNINDERLQSLILQEKEIAVEWIYEILEDMENKV